jgi:shikimate dehydrogenase
VLSPLCGVLGFPVAHSRSPAMMNAAFAELRLDWRYVHLPVPPERFGETVRALPGSGYVGANVTIPHKLAAFAVADEASAAARAIGAANTLTFGDGRIEADNTDAGGLLDAIGEPVDGCRALVLGAGGAARAAVWALREAGAEVAVWNRTAERARALAAEFGVRPHAAGREEDPAAGGGERPAAGAGATAAAADIVVNATAVGLVAGVGVEALPLGGLAPAVVVDMVYGAEPTPVVRWAHARGARVVDGLEVLVRQGARSLERWTGREAPIAVMRAAARGADV